MCEAKAVGGHPCAVELILILLLSFLEPIGMLKKLTPNLMVEDVKSTVQWYADKLGFQKLAVVPEDGDILDWAMVQRDGVALMFQSRASLGGEIKVLADLPIGASQSFYLEVEGINDLYQRLKEHVEII